MEPERWTLNRVTLEGSSVTGPVVTQPTEVVAASAYEELEKETASLQGSVDGMAARLSELESKAPPCEACGGTG